MPYVACTANCVGGYRTITLDGVNFTRVKCDFCDNGYRWVDEPKPPPPKLKGTATPSVGTFVTGTKSGGATGSGRPQVAGWRVLLRTATFIGAFFVVIELLAQTDLSKWAMLWWALGAATVATVLVARKL